MDALTVFGACLGVGATIVGATWALRTKLSDIEVALRGHVAEDKATFASHDARIIKLESRRGQRR